jgi:hypothetical protein
VRWEPGGGEAADRLGFFDSLRYLWELEGSTEWHWDVGGPWSGCWSSAVRGVVSSRDAETGMERSPKIRLSFLAFLRSMFFSVACESFVAGGAA